MTGLTLAQYRIDAELGRGGMGIVYKATDTKLNRTVALKVLPAAALASEDDRARFFREAQSAAQLSHPNIATVYQIDEAMPVDDAGEKVTGHTDRVLYIAMEYVEGESLADLVKRGPFRLQDAVSYAGQVAEALKEAHAKGIVHRDIKSANVMVTAAGVAKVLDFGLAKTQASTMLTRMGSTLGTVAYMSPEQARGHEVDGRTDLYSLGTMLYELVAGRLPFAGDYEQAILYGILNEPPEPLTAVRTGVPMQLEWIVNKLLTKEADYRYQTAADLIADLKSLDVTGSGHSRRSVAAAAGHTQVVATSKAALPTWVWPVVVAAMVLGLVVGWFAFRQPSPDPPLRQVEVSFDNLNSVAFPALSPGSRYLAVQAIDQDGRFGIWVKDIETGRTRYVEGSDVAGWEMRYSPDGTKLAFMRVFNQGVYFLRLPDGLPEKLTDFGRIAYWEDDETVVMTDDRQGGGPSYRVPIDGGELEEIRFDETGIEEGYGNVLKSGIAGTPRAFGLQTMRVNAAGNSNGIYRLFTANLDTGELVILDSAAVNPEYVRGGFLVYNVGNDDGVLNVRPVDPESGLFVGQAKDALTGGPIVPWGNFGVSSDGDLVSQKEISVIRVGNVATGMNRSTRLWRISPDQQDAAELSTQLSSVQEPTSLVLHPDGSALFFSAGSAANPGGAVYSLDLDSGVQTQITFGNLYTVSSVSPDGRWLYATSVSQENGVPAFKVVRIPLDGSGGEEVLRDDALLPLVSPDGRSVLLNMVSVTSSIGVSIMPLDGGEETLLVDGPMMATGFSPDGRYVLMASPQSGDITVYSMDGRERYPLPDVRGQRASFSRDGKHIHITNVASNLIRTMPVRLDPTFATLGPAEDLQRFEGFLGAFEFSDDGALYTASSRPGLQSGGADRTQTLIWMQNWASHLSRQFGR